MGDNKIKAKGKRQKAKAAIKKEIFEEMLAFCLKEPSKESCGILAGKDGLIDSLYPLTNISDSPKFCYLIDPKEQLRIFKELRGNNLEMLAIFHSHIDAPAYPSSRDIELAFYPESSYVIVSLADSRPPVARSFKIVNGRVSEEELVIRG